MKSSVYCEEMNNSTFDFIILLSLYNDVVLCFIMFYRRFLLSNVSPNLYLIIRLVYCYFIFRFSVEGSFPSARDLPWEKSLNLGQTI